MANNEMMIAANLTIIKTSQSGLAVLASNNLWFPKSQVELSEDQKKIVAMSPWIYEQKLGRIPENAVKVLSAKATKDFFKDASKDTPRFDPQTLAIGVYEKPDGSLYAVRPTKDKQRKYALRVVETPSNRIIDGTDESVTFEFRYEQGAINGLRPEMLITLKRADELSIRYGQCILCGRGLKVEASVRRGVGPVCVKYFPALA